MIPALLLLLVQAASPAATPPDDIVVTGHRAEKELAACLSRNCPPEEDVETSLRASVEQFAGGRYDAARGTLEKAIRRNRGYAAALPGPVSSLYATLATVAEHLGDNQLWLASSRNTVLVLRRHAGENNTATLTQELAFADDLIGLEGPGSANALYQSVQRKATERGKTDLAAGAAFRRAWLAANLGHDKEAVRIADEAVALAGSRTPLIAELRDILRARIAIRHGKDDAIDQLAARLRQSATDQPRLLSAPPVDDINPINSFIRKDSWQDTEIRFADVGYWIRPDGRTAGAELLRNAGLGQWAPGILKQVSARRYVPLSVGPDTPGVYRIDRFTVRGTMGTPTGSRIARRIGNLSVHIVDLTETDTMNAALRTQMRKTASNAGS